MLLMTTLNWMLPPGVANLIWLFRPLCVVIVYAMVPMFILIHRGNNQGLTQTFHILYMN